MVDNRRLVSALVLALVVAAYLATRLVALDADVPDYAITQVSMLDESYYALPALDLIHFGSFAHAAGPGLPADAGPINVAQNLATVASLAVVGDSLVGLRLPSVLFGLVALLAIVATVQLVAGRILALAAALLLVLDFSSLVADRTVEPTIVRFAAIAILVWLVARGTFLAERQGIGRSMALGVLVGAAVWFVYIYNLFLIPAFLVAVLAASRSRRLEHATGYLAGVAIATGAYFAVVWAVWGASPVAWYQTWIGGTSAIDRVSFSLANLIAILDTNALRFDPLLLGAFIVSIVVVARRIRTPLEATLLACLGLLELQTMWLADFPEKKFLVVLVFALPIVAIAIRRTLPRVSRRVGMAGAVTLAAASVFLVLVDARTVFAPTFTYRDTLQTIARQAPGQASAGDLSFAVQLYGASRAEQPGYHWGLSDEHYRMAVVNELRAGATMFSYDRPDIVAAWAPFGIVPVTRYDVDLPHGWVLAEYALR